MAPWDKISNIWKNVQEVDLRPIRREAERHTVLAIVGEDESERRNLADQLTHDARETILPLSAPLIMVSHKNATDASPADLILLLVDKKVPDIKHEQDLVKKWVASGKKVLVFLEPIDDQSGNNYQHWSDWGMAQVVHSSVNDRESLLNTFVPAVITALPDRLLSLGRHFPIFRTAIANRLINDTCLSNAVYAFSTGLAETVPVLDIPLNIADIIVLTKAQAMLVYRLGLLLGLSTEWRFYLAEFGSVVGGGFLWRQAARQLVGLIPVWGIVPKVAIAYAGTYAVGHTILRWYQTGRHLNRKEIAQLYRQAFRMGKTIAQDLAPKIPRLRLRRRKQLPSPTSSERTICSNCKTPNDLDALYCKQCGQALKGETLA